MFEIRFPSPHAGTVAFWKSAAPAYGCRAWREAMRRHARQHGEAVAMLADDSLFRVVRQPENRSGVSESTTPAGSVIWRISSADLAPADMPPELM